MTAQLFLEQTLNGLQQGVTLFLLAAGLTLVFGVMHMINLAHGTLYMVGAYVAATVTQASGNFLFGVLSAVAAAGLTGAVVRDPVQDAVVWREYLETVMKERDGWRDLYRACREVAD